jgi:hypothetical protein
MAAGERGGTWYLGLKEGSHPMAKNDVVTLRGIRVRLESDEGREFVRDCVRAAEEVVSDEDVIAKFEISLEYLQSLTKNKLFVRAVRNERERRLRSGIAVRESAQKEFIQAPKVMGKILNDEQANPRHRIESARELRAQAAPEPSQGPAGGERFSITINLGNDIDGRPIIEKYDEARTVESTAEQLKLAPKVIKESDG